METQKDKITRIINTIYSIEPKQEFMIYHKKNKFHKCKCSKGNTQWIRFDNLAEPLKAFSDETNTVYSGFSARGLDAFRLALIREYFMRDWYDIVLQPM